MTTPADILVPFDQDRFDSATEIWRVGRGEALPTGAAKFAKLVGFKGEQGQILPTQSGIVMGLGDKSEPLVMGAAASSLGAGEFKIEGDVSELDALGWALGAYRFGKYKSVPEAPKLVLPENMNADRLHTMVEATWLARDLVNTPAEDMGPDQLVEIVEGLGERFGAEVKIISGEKLTEGFSLVDAVGRAAACKPKLIDLTWGDPEHPTLTLVGKGVCFDSGGLNIKGGGGMSLMKKDMGGAANAIALALMVMKSELPYRLRLLVPAVENAIAGNAFRPGDVFKSRAGQTVEISNTDAEGRLILADALAYAAETKPDRIISLATLTGAARVALGPDVSPVYSTEDVFVERVIASGRSMADPCWRMPLWPRYNEYLNSAVADVNHASPNSFAGSITAALFLKRFVPDPIPYTHFDIFAWVPSARPGRPVGGEAMAIRALFGALSDTE